jgi:hypothetical protein
MSLKAFTQAAAEFQIQLEDMVDERKPEVRSTFLALLNDPDMRTPEILDSFLAVEIDRTIAETGNEEFADLYWGEVAELAELSFDELNSIPHGERGDLWDTARELMVAVSIREALIRENVYTDALRAGVDMGAMLPNLVRGIPQGELDGGHLIRTRIKEIKADKENG